MRRFLSFCFAVLFASGALPGLVQAATKKAEVPVKIQSVEGIDEYRLANGLQVLLVPDDSKPTTTVNLTYRVGSRHENYGETGMAHLLEHLMFKGTPKNPKVWAEFTRRGFGANGTTWLDRTNYFASFNANEENLRWFLSWQADAMVNSFIARKDLDSEMTVVRNEMEMGENSPSRILFEKTLATMYQWHNYGKSTIGARTDVENVDIARLQAFYRLYYQPDNATLIVSGKFDPAKVLAWIQADFGKIPAPKRQLPKLYTLDPVQDGDRQVNLHRVGGAPLLFAAYPVTPGAHPDFAAAELLGRVLAEAPAGRLHKALVEAGLAAGVFAFEAGLHDPGFVIYGTQLGPGQDIAPARKVLLETIESLPRSPVTESETERAKARWLTEWDLRFSNPEAVGVALSESVALGDWRLFFLQRDRVKALTAADLNRVAAQRLVADNRTLGTYTPTDGPVRAPAPAAVNVAEQMKSFQPVTTVSAAEAFQATPANIEARTRRFTIAPGLKVSLLPKDTRGDVAHAVLRVLYGDVSSLNGQEEVALLLASLLDKGTVTLGRQELQDRLTQLRASVSFGSAMNQLTASVVTTRANLPAVIDLLAQMLRQPALAPEALAEVRRQRLTAIEEARREPGALLGDRMGQHEDPYPRGDPRHFRSFAEAVEDLNRVTVEDLKAFHARFLGVGSAQFAAVGALDESEVRAALERGFSGWAAPVAFARIELPLLKPSPQRFVIETPDKQNANFSATLALPIREFDPDQAALLVANFALGSGGNSRLWKRIREREGLSYDVRSTIEWSSIERNSDWSVSAIFAPQNRAKVEKAIQEELDRVAKEGFAAAEIAEAKMGILNYRRLGRAQDAGLPGSLTQNDYLNRTFAVSQQLDDAIAAVTVEQATQAWRKYIDVTRLVSGVAGDFKGK